MIKKKVYGSLKLIVNYLCFRENENCRFNKYRKPAFLAQLCCARVFDINIDITRAKYQYHERSVISIFLPTTGTLSIHINDGEAICIPFTTAPQFNHR